MLATVQLDDQVSLYADEIDDVGTHWNLTTEVVASDLFPAESHPQTHLSIGHAPAKFAAPLKFRTRTKTHFLWPTLTSPASRGGLYFGYRGMTRQVDW